MRPLPVGGLAEVLGIAVETGRNGHAPGGIWLRFALGGGFLYTGDISANRNSMPTTRRPRRQTALVDCSYGTYEKPLAECWSELAPFVERGPLLLPVPANGRGPEIALEVLRHGRTDIYVDELPQRYLHGLVENVGVAVARRVRTRDLRAAWPFGRHRQQHADRAPRAGPSLRQHSASGAS